MGKVRSNKRNRKFSKKSKGKIGFDKNNPWMHTSLLLSVLLIVSIYANVSLSLNINSGTGINKITGNTVANNQQGGGSQIIDFEGLEDNDPVLGNPNAKVSIIAFEDYECPFCGRFHEQAFNQIKAEYIDTGKAKFVFRDFPLDIHRNAQKASEAAECANEQGKYWEMSEILFRNQQSLDLTSLKSYASQIELNQNQFNSCIDSGKYASEVQKDFADGAAAGVTGTPTFFINGQKIVGAQPFSVFKNVIDSTLSG